MTFKILEHTYAEVLDEFKRRYGRGHYHAAPLYREAFRRGNLCCATLPEFARSPELARRVEQDLALRVAPVIRRQNDNGLIKFVARLADGLEVESVFVPMRGHNTLCVSSQIGCRMGCLFCETATLGFLRNLTVEEIVGQVVAARSLTGAEIRNVVFMGMGEPLDNFANLIRSIRVLNDPRGLNIARRHVTVSTAGLAAGIHRLAALGWSDLNLAISLNAPNEQLRSQLMPLNRANALADLKQALVEYPLKKKGVFLIAYVLIQGVNDSQAHARQLAELLAPLKTRVNLIPYNPRPDAPYLPPSAAGLQRFARWLIDQKLFVRTRSPRGGMIRAGCGQLGNRALKDHRPAPGPLV